ncbi:MAG: PqqD family protein [Clostridia bacterium]|nr:PqqD family protein [Clostridia bacterium]
MRIVPGFVVREVGGKTFAVATGALAKKFHGMITLAGSGKEIWETLQEDTTEDQIVDKLLAVYDVDRETAARDVSGFVARLREAGLLLD